MIGKIIIVKTMAAGNIPGPPGGVLKIGSQPNVLLSHRPSGNRRGIRTKMPHRPYTTLGIAAKSSTMKISGVRTAKGRKSSLKNTAVPTPRGTAKSSAIAELTIVP
jgi:hypothetical protein